MFFTATVDFKSSEGKVSQLNAVTITFSFKMAMPSFSDLAQDDLSCPVCFELLKHPHTPKELDCSHVCCALCVQKMIEGRRLSVDCPECQNVTRIPKDGVTAMKTNFRLRSLAEKHEDHMNKRLEVRDAKNLCPEHNIIIDFFCIKCLVAGCSTCMLNKHKGTGHDTMNISDVHRMQKEQLNTIFWQMDAEIQEYVESLQELNTLNESMKNSLETQRQHIRKQFEITLKKVKHDAQRLEHQLDSIEQPKIDKVREEQNRLLRQLQEIKAIKSSAQNIIDTCPIHEYVEHHAAIAESITCELGKECRAPLNLNPVCGKAMFLVKNANVTLGTVSQVKKCRLVVKEELDTHDCHSVALTKHGFLAVCMQKPQKDTIRIYRRQLDGMHKKETSIRLSKQETTERPTCVAISTGDKLLVARRVRLEIYSLTGKYEGAFDFKPGLSQNGKIICRSICPYRVLVEKDKGILIADWTHSNIVQFTHGGVFVDIILVHFQPFRIALMPNGQLAASNWVENQVCLIDLTSKQVVKILEIHNAAAICYHEQSESILVGRCLARNKEGTPDNTTGVIEQYCPTTGRMVALISETHADDHYGSPHDMFLTNDNKLISADEYVVRVYNITC